LRKALEHYYLTLGRQDPVRIVIHFKGEKLRARKVGGVIGDVFGVIPRQLSRESERKPPESIETYEAFFRVYKYNVSMTKGAFADALAAMEQALARDPACGLAWSMLGNLYAHNHTLGFVHRETPLEEAVAFARKGAAMEPRNQ